MGRVHPSRSHCPAGLTGRGLQSRDWEGGGTSLSTHPCPALSRLGLQEEAWETRRSPRQQRHATVTQQFWFRCFHPSSQVSTKGPEVLPAARREPACLHRRQHPTTPTSANPWRVEPGPADGAGGGQPAAPAPPRAPSTTPASAPIPLSHGAEEEPGAQSARRPDFPPLSAQSHASSPGWVPPFLPQVGRGFREDA